MDKGCREKQHRLQKTGRVTLPVFLLTLLLCIGIWIEGAEKDGQGENNLETLVSHLQEDAHTKQISDGGVRLFLNGYEVPYDAGSNTFFVPQKAAWEGSLLARTEEGEVLPFFLEEDAYTSAFPNLEEAIRDNHAFVLLAEEEDSFHRVFVTFTGMPMLSLSVESSYTPEYTEAQIDDFVYGSETRYGGKMTLFDPERGEITNLLMQYHERGMTSAVFSKRGISLKLLNGEGKGIPRSLLGMAPGEDWKLFAMYTDSLRVRDMTCSQLWEEMTDTSASPAGSGQMEYCELVIDNVYQGVFAMAPPIDEHTLQLGSGDCLYKILDWYMPEMEEVQASIDAGYAVCYPIRARFPEVTKKNAGEVWEPWIKYAQKKYWSFDLQGLSRITDNDNLADFVLFTQAVAGKDGFLKNTYVTGERTTVSKANPEGFVVRIIPWDFDLTFGNSYVYNPEVNYTEYIPDTDVSYVEPVTEEYFRENISGAGDTIKVRYAALRENTLSTAHMQEVAQDNLERLLSSGAYLREEKRWPGSPVSQDLSELLSYMEKHMEWLDDWVDGL